MGDMAEREATWLTRAALMRQSRVQKSAIVWGRKKFAERWEIVTRHDGTRTRYDWTAFQTAPLFTIRSLVDHVHRVLPGHCEKVIRGLVLDGIRSGHLPNESEGLRYTDAETIVRACRVGGFAQHAPAAEDAANLSAVSRTVRAGNDPHGSLSPTEEPSASKDAKVPGPSTLPCNVSGSERDLRAAANWINKRSLSWILLFTTSADGTTFQKFFPPANVHRYRLIDHGSEGDWCVRSKGIGFGQDGRPRCVAEQLVLVTPAERRRANLEWSLLEGIWRRKARQLRAFLRGLARIGQASDGQAKGAAAAG